MAVNQAQRGHSLSRWEDARLVEAATRGDMDAFAELYRRYADHAWRVARRVTDNDHDAADAVAEAVAKVLRILRANPASAEIDFRPYLVVATRHAAVDVARRRERVSPTRDVGTLDSPTGFDQPGERAVADEDNRLIAQALTRLTERERLVLWLVEVENQSLAAAATVLGVKSNNAAQIAVRARRSLRRSYLRAHVGSHVATACGFTVEHLPAYLDGGLGEHSLKKIDEHLSGCRDCHQRLDDLKDLGLRLRPALLLPSLLGGRVTKWRPHRRRARLSSHRLTDARGRVSADAPPDVGALATAPVELARGASPLLAVSGQVTHALEAAAPAVQHLVATASAMLLVLGLATPGGGADPAAGSPAHRPSREASVAASAFDRSTSLPVGQPASGPPLSGAHRAGTAVASPAAAAQALATESPAVASGPPAQGRPGDSSGLEQTDEPPPQDTPAGDDSSELATGPPAQSRTGGSNRLERASQPAAKQPAAKQAPAGQAAGQGATKQVPPGQAAKQVPAVKQVPPGQAAKQAAVKQVPPGQAAKQAAERHAPVTRLSEAVVDGS